MSSRRISNQKVSPISLSNAKRWLRILDTDTSEDETVKEIILSALDYVETYLNKNVSLDVFLLSLSDFSDVTIDKLPFHSLVKIEYYNMDNELILLTAENYELTQMTIEDASIKFLTEIETYSREDGTKRSDTVKITYRAGYTPDNVPGSIKTAMQLLISKWFDNRTDERSDKQTAVERILNPLRNINV